MIMMLATLGLGIIWYRPVNGQAGTSICGGVW